CPRMKNLAVHTLAFWAGTGYNRAGRNGRQVADMSEEFGPDFITVTDEDGNEFELEHLDTLEYNGQTYMAFFPAVAAGQDGEPADGEEDYGLIILKTVLVNGEEQ